MKRMCFAAVVTLTCAGWTVQAVAQTTISTDGDVEAQGFIGDGSLVTEVDAQLLDGMDSSDFAQEADLMSTEAMLVALQAQVDALEPPDPPCFDTTQRFVDCANGTVTDTVSGLIYLKDAQCFGLQNWPTANQNAAGLADSSCGLTDGSRAGDWRLQTKEEWDGILMSSCATDPEIVGNQSPTPGCYTDDDADSEWASGVVSSFYWSSSPNATFATLAWGVNLNDGSVFSSGSKTVGAYVWPVRGGQ